MSIISIHALRKESDFWSDYGDERTLIFQSTLSVRRATVLQYFVVNPDLFQSTLSVRRATIMLALIRHYEQFQSTLSVRRATTARANQRDTAVFQSTLSVRRATYAVPAPVTFDVISIHALRKESDRRDVGGGRGQRISIHALRKESDTAPQKRPWSPCYFNPRSP